MITPYQKEQLECLEMVRRHVADLPESVVDGLRREIVEYLVFRDRIQVFLTDHFSKTCDSKCFQDRLSACCSKDGIITFFADVVVNVLIASDTDLYNMEAVLKKPHEGFKCVYLGAQGCLWRIKPINCEMFLCDEAENKVFENHPEAKQVWDEIALTKKRFTWPDRPVLFDLLEQKFMDAGFKSPLMYFHNSPGLLRIKETAMSKVDPNAFTLFATDCP